MQVMVIIGSTKPPIGLGIKGAVDRQRLLYESHSNFVIAVASFVRMIVIAAANVITSVRCNGMSVLRFWDNDRHFMTPVTRVRVIDSLGLTLLAIQPGKCPVHTDQNAIRSSIVPYSPRQKAHA
jgi:hypothetical protein